MMTCTGRVIPLSWQHFALDNTRIFAMIHSDSDGRGENLVGAGQKVAYVEFS